MSILEIKVKHKVMIDPSILIRVKTAEALIEHSDLLNDLGYEFVVPASFWNRIRNTSPLRLKEDPVYRFFLGPGWPTDPRSVESYWPQLDVILRPYKADSTAMERYSYLLEAPRISDVGPILVEEWEFLQQHSTILSRIRKSFELMVKTGAVTVEVGQASFDRLARQSLDLGPNSLLNHVDRLRAISKWIAVTSPPIVSAFQPVLGGMLSAGTGMFLLFDP